MIETIGAKQQDASALRTQAPQGVAQQGGQADPPGSAVGVAANGSADPVLDIGPYYSPVVRLDAETQRTVITFRDVSTGKMQTQYPSERQLEAYRASLRHQKALDERRAPDGAGTGIDGTDAQARDGWSVASVARSAARFPNAATDVADEPASSSGRGIAVAVAGLTDAALGRARPRLATVTA